MTDMSDFNVLAISYDDPDAGPKFAKSLHETGFAILKDHPINTDDIDRMYGVWSDYFSDENRFEDAVKPGEVHGYFGFKSENAKGHAQKDLKEFFHVYESQPVPAMVEDETRHFQSKMISIGSELLKWLDENTPGDTRSQFSESLEEMISGSDSN
ncbi:MAG: 2-oxoglutarate and iron-dependent oxygenase domain-containing protein, partial [Pseudomonadota bacterium]